MLSTQDLNQKLLQKMPWEEAWNPDLVSRGFDDGKMAWKKLEALAQQVHFSQRFPNFFVDLIDLVTESYDPDKALSNFVRFSEEIHDKEYLYTLLSGSKSLLKNLVLLFSGSQVLTDSLLKDPSHFDWLNAPETLYQSKTKDILFRDYYHMTWENVTPEATMSCLRKFKRREYIRIGLRDLMGQAPVQETVLDLSNLADVCLQLAYEAAEEELQAKYGAPYYKDDQDNLKESEFAILGMGKLGGQELNFSSDIDLIYIYTSSKGETQATDPEQSVLKISNHEYYTKLGQRITQIMNDFTPDGNVFRVDLDLRPEGKSGEIVNSLASCEIYYESWGRTWERQAMIKARVCAGSEALGQQLFHLLEPFVYRRSFDFAAVDEIKGMKLKINESLKTKKAEHGNIKLGFGGIREIEFLVQAYQLLFGGRVHRLRSRNTLTTLASLLALNFISRNDHDRLKEAYCFLRNLENRVQISFGLQTHRLPKTERDLDRLARKMNLEPPTAQRLMEVFEHHTGLVGQLFEKLFEDDSKQEAASTATRELDKNRIDEKDINVDLLNRYNFPDAERAFKILETLRDGPELSHPSERSLKKFYDLLPTLLKQCQQTPLPESALLNLARFMEASQARESYLDIFCTHEKFLELLLVLFGSSEELSQILVKHPGMIDVLMQTESLHRFTPPEKVLDGLNRKLATCPDLSEKKACLRNFKLGEELRIGIRYLTRESDILGTLEDLSGIADTYLQAALDVAIEEMTVEEPASSPTPLNQMAIIALGKHGGEELNFGSDLDLVFVYDTNDESISDENAEDSIVRYIGLSQMIYQLTSEVTPAGVAYKIDSDLRPEGNQGLLVMSIHGYRDYFRNRARVWERQALTRARFVAGNPGVGKRFLNVAQEFVFGEKLDYGSLIEISRSRERMEKELAREAELGKNVKLGYGGLVDIEFTVQIMQLLHGIRHAGLRQSNTLQALEALGQYGLMDGYAIGQLRKHYLFLRNLECALRVFKSGTNHLPKDPASLSALAVLLGYAQSEAAPGERLLKDYDAHTQAVRKVYRATIDKLLRASL